MIDNSKYLRFSAYSIKDLITRKLSEDTKFTDQVYEGSNLAILIDLVSYMYQCLLYQLNTSAAEAMFSDTQIYENINRLCKFIGYNPKGYSPSSVTFSTSVSDTDANNHITYNLRKYSAIDTEKTDINGKKIYYSLIDDGDLNVNQNQTVMLVNGIWKLYPTIFTSSGEQFQTFTLDGIYSNAEKAKYVSDKYIHVYIKDSLHQTIFKEWSLATGSLFIDNDIDNGSYIKSPNATEYCIRLNENKVYELSFGNNTNGMIPEKGAQIYIMYLDSNDQTTQLQPFDVVNKRFLHSKALFGMNSTVYHGIFSVIGVEKYSDIQNDIQDYNSRKQSGADIANDAYNITWSNTEKSSIGKIEESVEDIRRNAPYWFKTGNRLVTANDYEYFVKNRYISDIIDVKCQNNAEYITTFYRWLYNIGIKTHNNGNFYLTPNRTYKYDLRYSDAADANNVYIWIKMKNDAEIYKDLINSEIKGIKTLTHQPVYLTPITVYFTPCAQDVEQAKLYFNDNTQMFDPNDYSYIEVTIENNTLYANSNIQEKIAYAITTFFDENNFQLGQVVNNNDLIDKIFEIGNISNIRTVYFNSKSLEKRIITGIAFATWSAEYIDSGDDLEISPSSKQLETFQFPKLYNSANIINKIKVIRKSINNINTVQY